MEEAKQEPRFPRLGEPAPDFEAETTQGTVRLEDFKGSCLHQLAGAGLIEESNDCYHITGRGSALLSAERR